MSDAARSYAVVTAARNEEASLPRLADALAAQSEPPARWLVVDNGSTDGTLEIVRELERRHPWVRLLQIPGAERAVRAAPVVQAFEAGVAALDVPVGHVANIDADITFAPGYFASLMDAFAADPRLGIAGGSCYERSEGVWRQRFLTGTSVWGGSRLYRRACLDDVLPLEQRLGWDGMADAKANMLGWETRILFDLPFLHHRPEGSRDGSPWRARAAEGASARYMGYRPWYLVLRALRHSTRGPSGLGLVWGYAAAALAREPVCADPSIRTYVRRQQRLGDLPKRLRETLGKALGGRQG